MFVVEAFGENLRPGYVGGDYPAVICRVEGGHGEGQAVWRAVGTLYAGHGFVAFVVGMAVGEEGGDVAICFEFENDHIQHGRAVMVEWQHIHEDVLVVLCGIVRGYVHVEGSGIGVADEYGPLQYLPVGGFIVSRDSQLVCLEEHDPIPGDIGAEGGRQVFTNRLAATTA